MNPRKMRVLIAEDNLTNQTTIKLHVTQALKNVFGLDKENMAITVVSDGGIALTETEKELFDFIITDNDMPTKADKNINKSGLEFITNVRADKSNKNTDTFIFSWSTDKEYVDKPIKGANDFLPKPMKYIDLEEKLKKHKETIELKNIEKVMDKIEIHENNKTNVSTNPSTLYGSNQTTESGKSSDGKLENDQYTKKY